MGEAGTHDGEAGAEEGGSAGRNTQEGKAGTAGKAATNGEAGTVDDAGSGGTAGDSNVDAELTIAQPNLAPGKTYLPFTGKLTATGAAHYTWSVTSGSLPAGLALHGSQSATISIAGTPTEAGQFPISVSVTDGTTTKAVDVTLVITHPALFLSDRNTAGVNELFLTEIGAASAAVPVRLNASLPPGGSVSSYAWSPGGSKVLYLATQSAGGAAELWVASLASPGTAQRVSAAGITVTHMAWLLSGNVAAYANSAGDVYLVDLSAATPGQSRLAVPGQGALLAPIPLRPSPNGTSIGVTLPGTNAADITYVTWTATASTAVLLRSAQGSGPYFSYDGRFAVITDGPKAWWQDVTLPAPFGEALDSANGVTFSWSPNAEMLLIATGYAGMTEVIRCGFTGTSATETTLVPLGPCPYRQLQWSPDGKNSLFTCVADVRGIGNVAVASIGNDFSLLSSGFLSNSFTDIASTGWSPDSKWVALRADRDVDAQYDLQLMRWSAPGVLYKPHANSIASGVTTWAFAPNSQSIAFVGTIAPQSNAELYLSKLPASGAPSTAALVSVPASAVQSDVNWLAGSRVITYRATVSGTAQLFAVPVSADGTAGNVISISGASGSGVSSYQLAPTH